MAINDTCSVKVKVCGITNVDDARCAIAAGADYVGLIFAPSKRQVIKGQAKRILEENAPFSDWVAVFQNGKKKDIEQLADELQIRHVQFHGNETPAFCNYFVKRGFVVIKSIPVCADRIVLDPRDYPKVQYFLFDSVVDNASGGTGMPFSWEAIDKYELGLFRDRIFLAGGLSADNVIDAVAAVKPYAVDASSCLEKEPGVKDHEKVKLFLAQAHEGRGE